MNYNKFVKNLSGKEVLEHTRSYGHLIESTTKGVYVDGQKTSFESLEEARQHIVQEKYKNNIEEQIRTELYSDIGNNKIATLINEYHEVKVTDTLIESYVELASSKLFTLDPVVQEIRSLNRLDKLVEGKIDYRLEDGTVVAISESTQYKLQELFKEHQDVVEHMRQNVDNFLDVLQQIGE